MKMSILAQQSLVAVTNPKLIRPDQRMKTNRFSINGVEIGSIAKMVTTFKPTDR